MEWAGPAEKRKKIIIRRKGMGVNGSGWFKKKKENKKEGRGESVGLG